jgi:hypothetical protein
MATRTKLVTMPAKRNAGARLDPQLKDLIDRVIVPILVKEYLAVNEIDLAESPECMASSDRRTAATGVARP